MADGDLKLDANGDVILSTSGLTGLDRGVVEPCNCIPCSEDNPCSDCTGEYSSNPIWNPPFNSRPFCCYGCDTTVTLNFGDITLDAGAPSEFYYGVAVDAINSLANNSVVLQRVKNSFPTFFVAFGDASLVTATTTYFWRLRAWPPSWVNPVSGSILDVNWRFVLDVVSIDAFCPDVVGEPIPACPTGESYVLSKSTGTGLIQFMQSATTWRGDCTGPTDPTTPVLNADYYSAADDVSMDTVTTCGPTGAAASTMPTSVLVDYTSYNTSNSCFTFSTTSGTLTRNDGTPGGGVMYGAVNAAQCSAGDLLFSENPGAGTNYEIRALIAAESSADTDYECCWKLALYICTGGIQSPGCGSIASIKYYRKCGNYEDPTGTYTEVGGTDTIDVS